MGRARQEMVGRVLVLLCAVSMLSGGLIVGSESPASATCSEFEFIGARGSGQSAGDYTDSPTSKLGMGEEVYDVYSDLQLRLGPGRMTGYGVEYPAVGDDADILGALNLPPWIGDYHESVDDGYDDTLQHINDVLESCENTFFFLVGYSQGAQVLADVVQDLSPQQLGHVAGAAFFGDPYFNSKSWASQTSTSDHDGILGIRSYGTPRPEYPEYMRGRLFSYCHGADPICGAYKRFGTFWGDEFWVMDLGRAGYMNEHDEYIEAGKTKDAARRLEGLAGDPAEENPEPVYPPITSGVGGPVDVVFVVGTTTTMASEVSYWKNNQQPVLDAIEDLGPDARVALVDYRSGYQTYSSSVQTDFTSDLEVFSDAVDGLAANDPKQNSGDPVMGFSGAMTALNMSWRANARKAVIFITDDFPDWPEDGTGFTPWSVIDGARAKNVAFYGIIGYQPGSLTNLSYLYYEFAESTGATRIVAGSNVVPSMVTDLERIRNAPKALLAWQGNGVAGEPVSFTGAGSIPGSSPIVSYKWSMTGYSWISGTETDDPYYEHTFSTPNTNWPRVQLQVTDASGYKSVASVLAPIDAAPLAPPPMPIQAASAAGDGEVTLTWKAATSGEPPAYFTVRNSSNAIVERALPAADPADPVSARIGGLTNGTTYSFTVSAVNAEGESTPTASISATPVAPAVPAIAGASDHSIALKADGTVWAWGDNAYGELGNGTTTDSLVPVQVSGVSNAVSIAAGGHHSMAVLSDGTVVAWGANADGQLGNNSTTDSSVPVAVAGLTGITSVAVGGMHSLALKSDGSVWTWGEGDSGQLGNNSLTESHVPVQVTATSLGTASALSAGSTFSEALKSDGTVWTWGSNSKGQLGNGVAGLKKVPVQVSSLTGAVGIAAGYQHALAVKSDGTVWSWGLNGNGQLGNNSTTDSNVPVQVSGISTATQVAAGNNFSNALLTSGSVSSWGAGANGRLGNNGTSNQVTPVQITSFSAVSLEDGSSHGLALKSDGSVWSWGWNPEGQLGINSTTESRVPVQVTALQ